MQFAIRLAMLGYLRPPFILENTNRWVSLIWKIVRILLSNNGLLVLCMIWTTWKSTKCVGFFVNSFVYNYNGSTKSLHTRDTVLNYRVSQTLSAFSNTSVSTPQQNIQTFWASLPLFTPLQVNTTGITGIMLKWQGSSIFSSSLANGGYLAQPFPSPSTPQSLHVSKWGRGGWGGREAGEICTLSILLKHKWKTLCWRTFLQGTICPDTTCRCVRVCVADKHVLS